METELLSPAGDLQSAYAAFYYGADAVYSGLRVFSARADAVNLDAADLDEITAYAHAHGKKVYIALNTLLQDNELPLLLRQLELCSAFKVDALIIQDLGVARVVHRYYPHIPMHASTQMAIHNSEGALMLKKIGFSRVVLARELSLKEIEKIKAESGVEIEVFIHGALCYSYSGLCAFSSVTTGRSANRGKCIYACRGLYRKGDRQAHFFSMKDLALETDVRQLKGVSLKIEGRMKNALYVAAVTDYYRRILNTGRADVHLSDNLKQIFARPWTKLHFQGRNKSVIDPDFASHRGLRIGKAAGANNGCLFVTPSHDIERYDGIQLDLPGLKKPFGFSAEELFIGKKSVIKIPAGRQGAVRLPPKTPYIPQGTAVYLASSSRVKGAYPYDKPKSGLYKNKIPVKVCVSLRPDLISAACGDTRVSLPERLQPAKDPAKTKEAVYQAFRKTGNTKFELQSVETENQDGLFAPISVLNQLRRDLFAKLSSPAPNPPELISPFSEINIRPDKKTNWILKTDQLSLLKGLDLKPFYEIIYVINETTKPEDLSFLPQKKVRLSLPVIQRNSLLKPVIAKMTAAGYSKWQVGNLGGFGFLPAGVDISADDTIPVLNMQSLAQVSELGASRIAFSTEDNKTNLCRLSAAPIRTEIVVYQDTPLFISANCVRENPCAKCSKKREEWEIADAENKKYTVISDHCLTTLLKKEPFYINPLLKELTIPYKRIDFCHRIYGSREAQNIINTILSEGELNNTHVGNFLRGFA